jgi:hypothetical protein
MNERDMEYLGNINTSPGPNAGRSIDATKPRPPAAEPGILHNTVGGFKEIATRDTPGIYDNNPQPRLVEEIFDFDGQLIGFRVYDTLAADRSGK